MTSLWTFLSLLAAGAAGATVLSAQDALHDGAAGHPHDVPDMCEIRAETGARGLVLRAFAAPGLAGAYDFAVDIRQSGGSAQIRQGGDFVPEAGLPVLLGEISLNAGARYTARLEVETADGVSACRLEA